VQESSATVGTGNILLAGAESGYRTFGSAMGASDTCYYCLQNMTAIPPEWEIGLGVYTGLTASQNPNQLQRQTVIDNHLGTNAIVNFSGGTKDVYTCVPASVLRAILVNPDGVIWADRVQETTNTTSAQAPAIGLLGAEPGYRRFGDVLLSGQKCYYGIQNGKTGQWEIGLGQYDSGSNSLTRMPLDSSVGVGQPASFSQFPQDVYLTIPEKWLKLLTHAP
jgi:hypothetical protein